MKNYILMSICVIVALSLFSRCDESSVTSEVDTLYISSLDTVYINTTIFDTLLISESDTIYISETDTIYVSEADTLFLHVRYLTPVADASIFKEYDYNTPGEVIDNDTDTLAASGISEAIRVGASVDGEFKTRSLIKFDFADIPSDAQLISSALDFTPLRVGDYAPSVFMHKLMEDWTEGTIEDCCGENGNCRDLSLIGDDPQVCSNDRRSLSAQVADNKDVTWLYASYDDTNPIEWSVPGGRYAEEVTAYSLGEGSNSTFFASTGVTEDVESWISGASENYGWLLKADEDELERLVTEDELNGGLQIRYGSKESNYAPILTLMYLTKD